MVQVAAGELDFTLTSVIAMRQINGKAGPFQRLDDGPGTAAKLSMVMAHPIGARHVVVRADSGINSLDDIRGKRVFLGPPAGIATAIMTNIVKGQTGMSAEAGDFEQIVLDWGPGVQAFQDGQVDVLMIPGNIPDPRIINIARSTPIRIIGLNVDTLGDAPETAGLLRNPMNEIVTLAPDAYGPNQKNDEPVSLVQATVNLAVRTDLDEEIVYQMTKAFWDNIAENYGAAPWFESAITLENAVSLIPGQLHPGARRYYEEAGLTIPDPVPLSR